MKLSFVWWNTSLSPTSRPNRSSPEEREVALGLIEWLAKMADVDVICLGEISKNDIGAMKVHWDALGYSVLDGVSSVGKTTFDTCVLYKPAKMVLLDRANLSSLKAGNVLKIGQRFDFIVDDEKTVIHLFVAHWPSRLWCPGNHPDRHLLGVRLRDEIDQIRKRNGTSHTIVLGVLQ